MNIQPKWGVCVGRVIRTLDDISKANSNQQKLIRRVELLTTSFPALRKSVVESYLGDVFLVDPPGGQHLRLVSGVPQSSAVDAVLGIASKICDVATSRSIDTERIASILTNYGLVRQWLHAELASTFSAHSSMTLLPVVLCATAPS